VSRRRRYSGATKRNRELWTSRWGHNESTDERRVSTGVRFVLLCSPCSGWDSCPYIVGRPKALLVCYKGRFSLVELEYSEFDLTIIILKCISLHNRFFFKNIGCASVHSCTYTSSAHGSACLRCSTNGTRAYRRHASMIKTSPVEREQQASRHSNTRTFAGTWMCHRAAQSFSSAILSNRSARPSNQAVAFSLVLKNIL
jgi:hypothetical protein